MERRWLVSGPGRWWAPWVLAVVLLLAPRLSVAEEAAEEKPAAAEEKADDEDAKAEEPTKETPAAPGEAATKPAGGEAAKPAEAKEGEKDDEDDDEEEDEDDDEGEDDEDDDEGEGAKPAPPVAIKPTEAPVPVEGIVLRRFDTETRVRDAVTNAVFCLREGAYKDEVHLLVPPTRRYRVTGYETRQVHYTEKTIDYPIYKDKYETYETFANVAAGNSVTSERKLQKVTRTRLIGREIVKTEQRKILVHDPKGEIVHDVQYPTYAPGGTEHLHPGFLGENGLCIYALLQAGVSAQDPEFTASYELIANYLDGFGLPDRTWELAWLTAAYVNLYRETKGFKELCQRLVTRLLLGQETEGPGAGLWGPLCINRPLLITMLDYERKVYQTEVTQWEEKLKKHPKSERYKGLIEKGQQRIKEFHKQFDLVCVQGLNFDTIQQGVTLAPAEAVQNRTGYALRDATIPGTPYYIYTQNILDLESTAIALFALREAARCDLLPKCPAVPLNVEGESLVPPEGTRTIIERAVTAVVSRQAPDGTWKAGNLWLPVHLFDKLKLPGMPIDDKTFCEIESATPVFVTTGVGYAALTDALTLLGTLGPAPMAKESARALERGEGALQGMVKRILEEDLAKLPIGGIVRPYEFFVQLSHLLQTPGGPAANGQLWTNVADHTVGSQAKEGFFWPAKNPYYDLGTGLTGYFLEQARRQHETAQAKLPKDQAKPFSPAAARLPITYGLLLHPETTATAYAIIFLTRGMRKPILGIWALDEKAVRTATVRSVVGTVKKAVSLDLDYTILGADLPSDALDGLPALYLTGTGTFNPAGKDTLPHLQYYLALGNGLLIVEAEATPEGSTFLDSVTAGVRQVLPAAAPAQLELKGLKAKVPGLVLKDRVVAVFCKILPRTAKPGAEGLASGDVRWALADLLRRNLSPLFLSRDFPLDLDKLRTREQERPGPVPLGEMPTPGKK